MEKMKYLKKPLNLQINKHTLGNFFVILNLNRNARVNFTRISSLGFNNTVLDVIYKTNWRKKKKLRDVGLDVFLV